MDKIRLPRFFRTTIIHLSLICRVCLFVCVILRVVGQQLWNLAYLFDILFRPCDRIFRPRWFVGKLGLKSPWSFAHVFESAKRRSRSENLWNVCLLYYQNCTIIKRGRHLWGNSRSAQRFVGWADKLILQGYGGFLLLGQQNLMVSPCVFQHVCWENIAYRKTCGS